jgi:hypothetical protein
VFIALGPLSLSLRNLICIRQVLVLLDELLRAFSTPQLDFLHQPLGLALLLGPSGAWHAAAADLERCTR